MIRNIWSSDSAEIYGVEFPELVQAIGRHHPARCKIGFAAPVKRVPIKFEPESRPGSLEHTNALWYDLLADTITRNDRDRESFQKGLPRPSNFNSHGQ